MDFVHLHVHSEYSLLDGASRVAELPRRARELGMGALALTDHGVMYGAIDFYKACRDAGVKPIFGCEAYLATRTRHDRQPKLDDRPYHFLLLARNQQGYRNLTKLVSLAYTEGLYYKPRLDLDLLADHAEGLIATSACLAGPITRLLDEGREEKALEIIRALQEILGPENFYLEIQDHGIDDERRLYPRLVELGRRFGIPLVATNDVHYIDRADARAQEVLMCIQLGKTLEDGKRLRFENDQFYLKSPREMADLFRDVPEALANTVRIAEACHVDLELGRVFLPAFAVPSGETEASYLRRLCHERLPQRYPDAGPEVRERLEYELSVIEKMGYPAYFLIVWDFIDFARRKGIPVGPGRGSAAGSMVAYLLGITNVDPLRFNLLFERFLNPERVSLPDIDIDFCYERRDEVIDYVVRKYGEDRVAQIITFGTMAARAVIRDVGRVLGMPYGEVDRIAKMVPAQIGITLDDALALSPDLAQAYQEDDRVRELIDLARSLEGLPRHASVHAAGVVIAPGPIMEYVPLQKMGDGTVVTQFDWMKIEEVGLLKMDFLGLRTLTVMNETCRLVEQAYGERIDLDALPLDDAQTYQLLGRGETAAVFQLESGGMRDMLRELKPSNIEDVIAAVALYRPGPMQNIPEFIKSKHEGNVKYLHPDLEPVLRDTYGVMIYQEQVMQVASKIAGFSLGKADLLRRAMGKKKKEIMDQMKAEFIAGAVAKGYSEDLAEKIYDLIERFASYGFNRCIAGDARLVDARTGEELTIRELYERADEFQGFEVLAVNEREKLRPRRVLKVMYQGDQPVWELRTRSGRSIKATCDHPFWTFSGWRRLDELKPGDRVAVARRLPVSGQDRWPYHCLALLGYLLAEGNLCPPYSFYFYAQDDEELDDYTAALEAFHNTQARRKLYPGKKASEIYAKRIDRTKPFEAVEWVRSLGIWGKTATEKAFPDAVFVLASDDLAVLLAKMWVGDGCVDAKQGMAYYATSSEVLARQLQHLLLRLDIRATLQEKAFKYRGTIRRGWAVTVHGYENVRRLSEKLGSHLVGRRARDLKTLVTRHPYLAVEKIPISSLRRGTSDTIPAEVLATIRTEATLSGASYTEISRLAGVSLRNFTRQANKKGFRRETVQAIADALESRVLDDIANSDLYYDEIVDIRFAGIEPTYDLTVEPEHNFVANEFIVHNCHSAPYGLLAYQTAYLKVHYPVAYMAATLTSFMNNSDKIAEYILECQRMGIRVLPPDVNRSQAEFTVEGKGAIRFGLAAVKNVGRGAIQSIVKARQQYGAFTSLRDFCEKVDSRALNRRVLESLIKAGAFDGLGGNRAQLLAAVETTLAAAAELQKQREQGQMSFFDVLGAGAAAESGVAAEDRLPDVPEFPLPRLLALEKEVLGVYLSGHPLSAVRDDLEIEATTTTLQLRELADGVDVRLGGIVLGMKQITTRSGDRMAFVTLEDLTGQVEVVVFPRTLSEAGDALAPDAVVVVDGKVSWQEETVKVVADRVRPLRRLPKLYLRLRQTRDGNGTLVRLREILAACPGEVPVYLEFVDSRRLLLTDRRFWVNLDTGLQAALRELLGEDAVRIAEPEPVAGPGAAAPA